MDPHPDTLAYRPPAEGARDEPPPPPPRRTLRTWLALWTVWLVGLAVWAFYLALIAWLVFRLFGTAPSRNPAAP